MARALAPELPEAPDVVQRDRRLAQRLILRIHGLDAREVQQAVEQHRGVPGREHEPIAVRPDRVLRVVAQEALPQAVRDRRHRHRRAGVARIGLLDGVHRQRANGVDAELVESRLLGG
jgi:hypothetical protein